MIYDANHSLPAQKTHLVLPLMKIEVKKLKIEEWEKSGLFEPQMPDSFTIIH